MLNNGLSNTDTWRSFSALFLVGFFFGHVFEMLVEDIKRYEKPISLVLVAVVLAYYLIRRLVWRKVSVEKA